MSSLSQYLIVSSILFAIGFAGVVINRKNLIILLMSIELMLLAVNTNFVAFARFLHLASGEVVVFFILAVAAVESAIGLAILVLLYRKRGNIDVSEMNELKG